MSLMRVLETRVPPPVIAITFGAAMWLLVRRVPAGQLDQGAPWPLPLALAVLGVGIALWGVVAFRVHRTTVNPLRPEQASALVTGGIYKFTRNPMYLGMAIVLTGWAVALAHFGTLALLAGFVAFITRFQIVPEERVLKTKFSAEFDAYCRRVRRWI